MINPDNMLRSLRNYIVEHLEKTEIFEMAYSRREFKNKVEGFIQQIVENIFLIKLSQRTTKSTENINHWLQELDSYVEKLHSMSCESSKRKAYLEVLDKMEIDDTELIRTWCLKKLRKEQKENHSSFKNLKETNIDFDIWNEIIYFINKDILEIIELPRRFDTENELSIRLDIV